MMSDKGEVKWVDFHAMADTPKRRGHALVLVEGLKNDRIMARIVGKKGRSGRLVVVQIDAGSWDKVKEEYF